jgi:hypothetical protein
MKTKQVRLCSSIFIMVLVLSAFYSFVVKAQVDYYHKEFKWSYKGLDWTWSLDIPKALYEAYKSVPVSTRLRYQASGYGLLTTTNDAYLQMVAEKLKEASSQEGYESYDEVSFVLAFIQSLPYTSDSVTSGYDEYPRFPLETLVDNGGDCEDTSILFATLTLIMDYGTVYISPPEHYAVGILGEEGLPGYYWTLNDKLYYYCETTGDGWKIGDLPPEFQDEKATIYEIREYQQYVPESWSDSPLTPSPSMAPNSPTSEPSFLSEDTLNVAVAIFGIVCVIAVFVIIGRSKTGRRDLANNERLLGNEQGFYCRYCGSENKVDAVFCEKCGKQLK